MSQHPKKTLKDFTEITSARVGLGHIGHAQPTQAVLNFQISHAAARSAVNKEWDHQQLSQDLQNQNEKPLTLFSKVDSIEKFLKFPQMGRQLSPQSKSESAKTKPVTFAFIVSNGLSAFAIENHFLAFWKVFKEKLQKQFPQTDYQLVLTPFGRVAVSDEIGETLKARMSVIFLGERPGLNSADSMGIYLTYNPKAGNSDAQRNCISNVRPPQGLSYEMAADKLLYLMSESLRLQLSGVNLKDEFNEKMIAGKS